MSSIHGIAAILLLTATPLARAEPSFQSLEARSVPVGELAQGFTLKLGAAAPGYRAISVTQGEADVVLLVRDAAGREWKYDAPARRAGPERALVYDDGRGLTITLSSPGRFAFPTRTVRLDVAGVASDERIQPGSTLQAKYLESKAALEISATPRSSANDRALEYVAAARIWKSRGDHARAGFAYLQAAWMLARRTSNHVDALKNGALARAEFTAAGDSMGAALAILQMTVPRTELMNANLGPDGKTPANKSSMPAELLSDLTTAIATFDSARLPYFGAMARIQLAASHYMRDDLDSAIRLLGEATDYYKRAGASDGAARALANRCLMIYQTGRFNEAAAAFDAVIAGKETADFPEVTADILDNSAVTQAAAGRYDKALSQFVRALSIHESLSPPDVPGMARSLNGIASTYLSRGNARAAIVYAQQAREELAKRDSGGVLAREPARLNSLLISGRGYRELGNFVAAEAAHREALALASSDYVNARARLELAGDALDRGLPGNALAELHAIEVKAGPAWEPIKRQLRLRRAQALLLNAQPELAIDSLGPLRGEFAKLGAPELELELLQTMGRAQLQRGRITDALAASDQGIAQLKTLRLISGNPELRANLNDVYRSTYALRVEVLNARLARESAVPERDRLIRQVFAASDEARAGLARATPLARSLAAIDESSTRASLAAEISLRQSMLADLEANGVSAARMAILRAELAARLAKFDADTPGVDAPLPSFNESDYSTAGLRNDTAILAFLQSAGLLHRYLITRDTIRELEPRSIAEVERGTSEALKGLGVLPAKARPDANASLKALSALLVPSPEFLKGRPQLIVVGDKVTARVPFAALNSGADQKSPLIREHYLTMALTLRDALDIARVPDRAQRIDMSRVAVFFDPVFTPIDERVITQQESPNESRLLVRLGATALEAKAIAESLPGRKVESYSGFNATREKLLSPEMAKKSVLHLATHAVAIDRWPNGSGLMLSSLDPAGAQINGYVTTLDLFARRTETELVVLSACETSRGESGANESVAGLARATLGGGARRVVASQWMVDDVATARLMREFYQRLAAGDSAARALGAAQRTLSADSQLSSPARWAAFAVYERAPGR